MATVLYVMWAVDVSWLQCYMSCGLCLCLSPEKGTDGSLQGEDWALNMEICDIINETEDG